MASFFTIHEASNDSTDLFWLARRPDCIQAVAKRLSLPELFDFCTLSREEYTQFMLDSHFVDSIDELASDMRKAIEDAPEEIPWFEGSIGLEFARSVCRALESLSDSDKTYFEVNDEEIQGLTEDLRSMEAAILNAGEGRWRLWYD